jgi:myosin heavy subunit
MSEDEMSEDDSFCKEKKEPNLDSFEDPGFHDLSEGQTSDALSLATLMSNGAELTSSFQVQGSECNPADSTELMATSYPHQDSRFPSSNYVPLISKKDPCLEENKPISNSEMIGHSTQVSECSNPVIHIYHQNVMSGDIQQGFGPGKTEVQSLLQQIETLKKTNRRLKDEITKKEEDFNELESLMQKALKEQKPSESEQKIQELEQKLAEIQQEMKAKEDQHWADIEHIETLNCKLNQRDSELETEREKTQELQEDLSKALSEKFALEKQKIHADLKLEKLKRKFSEDVSAIKDEKHKAELETQEERRKRENAVADKEIVKLQAQMEIHKAKSANELQSALRGQAQVFTRRLSEAERSLSTPTGSSTGSVVREDLLLRIVEMSLTQTSCEGQSADCCKQCEDCKIKGKPSSES